MSIIPLIINKTGQGGGGGGGDIAHSFETVSKNLSAYPATLTYTGDELTSIAYNTGSGTITKTFGYSGGQLTTITLSGDTPAGIDLVKTLVYSLGKLVGATYS